MDLRTNCDGKTINIDCVVFQPEKNFICLYAGNESKITLRISNDCLSDTFFNSAAELSVADDFCLREEGCGNMYDLELTLTDGDKVLDAAESFFGMRKIKRCGNNTVGKRIQKTVFSVVLLDWGILSAGKRMLLFTA